MAQTIAPSADRSVNVKISGNSSISITADWLKPLLLYKRSPSAVCAPTWPDEPSSMPPPPYDVRDRKREFYSNRYVCLCVLAACLPGCLAQSALQDGRYHAPAVSQQETRVVCSSKDCPTHSHTVGTRPTIPSHNSLLPKGRLS